MDGDALYYDTHYWHPGGTPAGKGDDRYRSDYGFPTIPKLLDAARRPFTAAGLNIPWYTCFGNHDGLSQGNFPTRTIPTNALATGSLKVISPPAGVTPADILDPEGSTLDQIVSGIVLSPYAKRVTPDPKRASSAAARSSTSTSPPPGSPRDTASPRRTARRTRRTTSSTGAGSGSS